MSDLTFELAPRPGTPASQRKAELDNARFVAVRNMAYMHYKDANGVPLMTYHQTLEDRERVKQVILQHEIACGLVVPDQGAPSQPPPMAAPQAAPAPQPQPSNPYPNQTQQVPQMMTPAYAVPPPPQAPATAQQAAQAAVQAPQGQPEPAAAAPTGRKRRAAGTAPAGPQMTAAAPMGQMVPAAPQPQMGVPAGFPAPPLPPAPAMGAPMNQAPAQQYQQPAVTQQAVPQGVAQVDLTPVLTAVAELGRGLGIISKDVEALGKKLDGLVAQVNENHQVDLAALFHIYGQHQSLYQLLGQGNVQSLADFRNFIKKYTGP